MKNNKPEFFALLYLFVVFNCFPAFSQKGLNEASVLDNNKLTEIVFENKVVDLKYVRHGITVEGTFNCLIEYQNFVLFSVLEI